MTSDAVFALVLAAGASRRFGAEKLSAPLNGRPMLSHVLDTLREARERGLVTGVGIVTQSAASHVHDLIEHSGFVPIINAEPDAGLSRSLQLGLEMITKCFPEVGGVLVFMADQPWVQLGTIETVIGAWRLSTRPVVRPRYLEDEAPGHPVLIGRDVWPQARTLRGDVGFGAILTDYPELVTTVDIPGSNPDIDTPDDLRRHTESA
jgi:CTP:molybdopterin cytidylyltransferase MocA